MYILYIRTSMRVNVGVNVVLNKGYTDKHEDKYRFVFIC